MQQVTAEFLQAMKNRAMTARLVLDDGTEIQGDPIIGIDWTSGSNADSEKFVIGSAVAGGVQIVLDRKQTDATFEGRTVLVQLGSPEVLPGEWLDVGSYRVTKPQAEDDMLTVTGLDALGVDFETEYEPLAGLDFEAGVNALELLAGLCQRRGVGLDMTGLSNLTLTGSPPEGSTERQIIGWVAGLYGGFAVMSRTGFLQIRRYTLTEIEVGPGEYYSGKLSSADHQFTVQWLTHYSEVNGQIGSQGDVAQKQGVHFECPWVTVENAASIWAQIGGLSYRPVKNVEFFGDPRIDAGDIITVSSLYGGVFHVPVMSLWQTFDGGLATAVSAAGQTITDGYTGPLERTVVQKVDSVVSCMTQEQIFNKLTNNGTVQGIYLQDGNIYINGSYIASGTIVADLIKAGILQSADGKTFRLDLDKGTFSMEGSGKFLSEDGQTCIEVLGNELVLYSKDGEGQFIEKVHIGFTRGMNPAGTGLIDYPYIIFGSSETASVGLIKKFYDGIFFGNSVLKDAVGKFSGAEGVAGFFVSTAENKAYVVAGTEMQNVYTGEAVARFA